MGAEITEKQRQKRPPEKAGAATISRLTVKKHAGCRRSEIQTEFNGCPVPRSATGRYQFKINGS
jgi:hypothetical protein